MAWSASEIFSSFITDKMNHTTNMDLNADSIKAALYDNDITPDQTVASASAAYNAGQWAIAGNEVSNGGWAAGGVALASVTSAFSSATYTFDAADTANGTAATLSAVFGCLVYDDTITTPVADQGISYHYFGGTQSVTSGTFTIVWNASGIFSLTL
jgi:hypothetical protein